MIVIVTGTPGTGKTRYAKRLAKEKDYKYVDVNKIIDKYKIKKQYNRKLRTYDINIDELNEVLIKLIKEARKKKQDLVIDSHLSHYLPLKYVNKCIVMRCCDLKELRKRLKKRGYHERKIMDNLEAEIMQSCLQDAVAAGHKVMVVDGC